MGIVFFLEMVFPTTQDLNLVEKKFLELLKHNIIARDEVHGIVISPANSFFTIRKAKLLNGSFFSLVSNTNASELTENSRLYEFLAVLGKVVAELNPIFAYWGSDYDSEEGIITSNFEYYSNPYFFCVEPLLDFKKEKLGFLYDVGTLKKFDEFKKVLSTNELRALLKKHSLKLIQGKEGLGVIKEQDEVLSLIKPRYFVRQYLREKNVNIDDGLAELAYYEANLKDGKEIVADKILSFANKNLEPKFYCLYLLFEISFALKSCFIYRPKETFITLKKFMEKNPNYFWQDQTMRKITAGELIAKHYFDRLGQVQKFLELLVELNIVSKEKTKDPIDIEGIGIAIEKWGRGR